jgi:hypothetical protein
MVSHFCWTSIGKLSEPVFLNVYGAKESISSNEFRQPIAWRAGAITLFHLGS